MFPTKRLAFQMQGLEVSSQTDATHATGATLFYFPKGAAAAADIRGGSAATSETTLLDTGSYTNIVEGILFAGGSTMGLAAAGGVRDGIFQSRPPKTRNHFVNIPSVPAAVVYDYTGRIFPGQDPFVYPSEDLGRQLLQTVSGRDFICGRAGAGVSTTANKLAKVIWGGQGMNLLEFSFGKVFAAVVNNPMGTITVPGVKPIADFKKQSAKAKKSLEGNTTLSIVVTDVALDPGQLKRLAVQVHTSMARSIFPFQSFSDGDSHFAVSLGQKSMKKEEVGAWFLELSLASCKAMKNAIEIAVRVANKDN